MLVAACEAMDVLAAETAPLVLRFPVHLASDLALPLVAGTFEPHWVSLQLCVEARRRVSSGLRATGGQLYLAGWDSSRYGFCWGERATTLSKLAADHQACLGTPPPDWAALPIVPAAQDRVDDTCAICYGEFEDMLPSSLDTSRSPPGRWECSGTMPHSVCRGCDPVIQAAANNKCPLCRADRWVLLQP